MWVEKHGPGFRIRDLQAGRKVTLESGYPNKTQAKNAMIELKADQLRGQALRPRGGRVLLADFVATWQPSWEASLKPSSHHSETGRVRNHILPLLGKYALDDVDPQDWVAKLAAGARDPRDPTRWLRKPIGPKTIRNCHGILHTIMDAAIAAKLIRANPCASTNLPLWERREMRFLTDPEIARLIAALPVRWRPLVLLLVSTGLRWGEAAGLAVGSVDLLAKAPYLRVVRALYDEPGSNEVVFVSPKTKQSRRTVTLSETVVEALVALVCGRGRDELLFTSLHGGPIRGRRFRRVWIAACERAGLEGLRVHDLRHTHVAILISAGQSLTAIQRRLGHSSIAVTSDLYGHLRAEVDPRLLAAIEDALAGVDMDAVAEEVAAELVGAE